MGTFKCSWTWTNEKILKFNTGMHGTGSISIDSCLWPVAAAAVAAAAALYHVMDSTDASNPQVQTSSASLLLLPSLHNRPKTEYLYLNGCEVDVHHHTSPIYYTSL